MFIDLYHFFLLFVTRANNAKQLIQPILLWPPAPDWLGRCQYNVIGRDRSHGLLALSRVWQHIKLSLIISGISLRTRPRYGLVVDEDVKKSNKHDFKCNQTCTNEVKMTQPFLMSRLQTNLLTLSNFDFFIA